MKKKLHTLLYNSYSSTHCYGDEIRGDHEIRYAQDRRKTYIKYVTNRKERETKQHFKTRAYTHATNGTQTCDLNIQWSKTTRPWTTRQLSSDGETKSIHTIFTDSQKFEESVVKNLELLINIPAPILRS
jgi:hypothetical protein